MKCQILLGLGVLLSSFSHAETAKNTNVFAALAIDKSNGFAYGFSHDYSSSSEAEKRALSECSALSKNCSVVLAWSGKGCGAYRTVDEKVGTAYGWGLAVTSGQADIIATQELMKRTNGPVTSNYVWACNTKTTKPLKTIKNLNEKKVQTGSVKTVTIGDQVWMANNLATTKFQNGDKIPLFNNIDEYKNNKGREKTAFSIVFNKEHFYNWYAATDSRNICPTGFRVPITNDWNILINYINSDQITLAYKLKSKNLWRTPGSDEYNFNAKPTQILMWDFIEKMNLDPKFSIFETAFWSQTPNYTFTLSGDYFLFDATNKAKMSGNKNTTLASVRCIKE
ncbi:DUF4189 domain-containing protein [Acinetobacter modestus]|uniref:FISUMP domain-containing protein n=1 Tax=Acinetobacter modestus TaxID=1776740 RepID=UPI00202FF4C3|nr:FISUMP domain-containing protein [Acinetobacter modestus]MCM1958294.1 DUF4189 domain-containing protein [Acinetobacter modestus]